MEGIAGGDGYLFAVVLGTVHLPHAVMADGKPLPAGTYQSV